MKTIALFAAAAVSLFAAYTYYYTDTFTSINLTNWTQNGSLTAGASGLQPGNPDGGSLISRIAPPGGGQAYEIWTALNMNNTGGSFVHYLRASDDARLGPVESGSFFAVEARNLQGQGQGGCAMELRIWSRIGGVTSLLSTTQTGCYANTTVRTVISGAGLFQNVFLVYVGELDTGGTTTKAGSETPVYQSAAMTLAGGRPGVGAFGTPNGNAITRVHLGPPDTTPPSDPSEFKTTALPQSVDFQWRGSVDDANGTGITWYHILRNGTFMAYVPPGIAWTDSTVSPGTNYTYHIVALDRHMNASNYVAVPVTTPPPGSIDQRKVGLRPLGAYWGAMGEQIDMQSGNLNFTVPLLMVKGRAGMAVPVSLSYNSQNWRQDAAGTWKLGRDVGNGFGWRLMAGSLTAHYTDWWTVHHYTFADASGAEYRLDVNTNGVWTSTEPFYGRYVTAENRLFFPDGSFWHFGSVALGSEEDAGTRYPTLIQDSNGNQIIFRYRTGSGAPPGNTSSRIHQIEDPRASSSGGSTYGFTYDPQGPRRVLSIANYIGTSENYSFTYAPTAPTVSPFDSGLSIGTARTLSSITTSVGSYSLTYGSNNSGELTKVTLPSGGELEWEYQDFEYVNGKKFREVSKRWARANPSATRYEWQLTSDPGDPGRDVHNWRGLGQPGGDSSKVWFFNTSTGQNTTGLAYRFDDRAEPNNGSGLIEKHLLFSSDSGGRPYVSEILTVLNPGTPHVKYAKVEQTVDTWGNLTQQKIYAHDEWFTPERTLNYTYLTGSEYSSRYIRNRVTQVQLTPAGKPTVTLASYTYDPSYPKPLSADGIRQHDSSKNGDFRWRGNVREVVSLGAPTQTFLYDIGGNVVQVSGGSAASNTTMGSGQNYLVPTAITPHADASLTSSFQYEPGFLRIQSATGPNADQASFTYDALARPASTVSPHGATTQYTYNGLESTTATTNGKWTKTTRDGFGRTVKVESGHGSTTVSLVETEYAPCACSPLGRAWRVSMPRAPGGPLHWTTYTYDAAGRTLSVTPPGNAGSTTYVYEGNTVKVTDPSGKWKKFETDAFGNLVKVSEPPASGVDPIVTTYEYNHFNKLTKVNMPRDGITQTRTFEYNTEGLLTKTIFPETGTTTFTYDSDKRLYQKNDNKGQRIQYEYDSHHRLQYIRRYPVAGGPEDENQRTTYVYGNNPSLANAGRLIQIRNGYREIDFDGGFTENFSYNTAGLILAKNINWNNTQTGGLTVSYTYDPEGRRTATTYPTHYVWNGSAYVAQAGRAFTYTYDAMGRPASMLEGATPVVSSVSYNVAGQITAMTRQYQWDTESRTYNPRGQLTRQTG
ncbi:MAG TPA: hypothetical protein PLF84_21470, partial [Bryobacteraceae bacterium]|nr:hypothetical protein [Bryobacteraceae bacterium]